ncbi:hypothetical protein [Cohnella candidum]|uniref:Uncharacterized protein n=1 Tax=Cohnella candidum TaxID=2674991 RepID=A0A3G3JW65_9BACL|nr:hypothetical protein [Cohnella candidum]AYQ72493.1 hypothetical protein EAV92_07890 [Cohnella candidum]
MKMIKPGIGVDQFTLGISIEELLRLIDEEYEKSELADYIILKFKYYKFWIHQISETVTQILVSGQYPGKLHGKIGIGNTMQDVDELIGKYVQDDYVYIIPDLPGVCFELKDVEDSEEEWNNTTAPIEKITVYTAEEV